jgi:hypothetical protein
MPRSPSSSLRGHDHPRPASRTCPMARNGTAPCQGAIRSTGPARRPTAEVARSRRPRCSADCG